ncbi:MAG: hypothetical protein ABSC48_13530 [Terracidiphilus sp.]|jgi:hypothetical protein
MDDFCRRKSWLAPEGRAMRMNRAFCLLIALLLVATVALCQSVSLPEFVGRHQRQVMGKNLYFAKGGIGIINHDLFIDLKSNANELRLEAGKRWIGNEASTAEVVIVYGGRIWPSHSFPAGADWKKCAVVSFEEGAVRFFDFRIDEGGYYIRHGSH